MIKIEKTKVYGWEAAIRGMRNPMNSWGKSDSYFYMTSDEFKIGENDLKLMKSLSKAGNDHGKFMRMINLILTAIFGLYGYIAGIVILILAIVFNKTISGQSYIYPILPFDLKQLSKRFLRKRLPESRK